jgi:cytochrome c-type biogenesis protein CcmH/NrfF
VRTLASAAVLLVLLAAPAAAAPEDVANDISLEIMSPFCDGVTLHDCPSQEAQALRARIQEWAGRGHSKGEIINRLEREFGPGILGAPKAEGSGFLAWLPPLAVLAAGVATAFVVVRSWSRRRAPAAAVNVTMTSEERSRLDYELAALRSAASAEERGP